jgi:hypothetical protein
VVTAEWSADLIAFGDTTLCATVELSNDSAIMAAEIAIEFSGADRVVVYRSEERPDERAVECEPLAGGAPLAIARSSGDKLRLEPGLGYALAPHQRLRIEVQASHGSSPPVRQHVTIAVSADQGAHRPVSMVAFEHRDFELAPNAAGRASRFIQLPRELATARFAAFAAHTGAHGAGVQVATAASPTGDRVLVHAPAAHHWSAPAFTVHEPAIAVPEGGGFYVQCQYYNPTARVVDDELCGFWAYYVE